MKTRKRDGGADNGNPERKANPVSRLFYFWLLPLLRKGERKDLNLEDVYDILPEYSSAQLGPVLETEWDKEVTRGKGQPKLWRLIRSCVWKVVVLAGIGYSVDELVLRTIQPLVLKKFIRTFSVENPENDPDHRSIQFIYASVLVLVTFGHAILYQQMYAILLPQGIKVRLWVSQLIYRKILHLRKTDSEHSNVGKLCNLLSSDVGRLETCLMPIHTLYIAPLQLLIYTYLLWSELGVASLAGVACILAIIPIQWFLGSFSMHYVTHISKRTDERGRFLNEFVGGVRLIKMYAWEKPFAELVSKLRRAEIKFIGKHLNLKGFYTSFQSISFKLIPFCALTAYVALGNSLTADKAFFAISVFNLIIQTVINRLPRSVAQVGEILASLRRIENFLLSQGTHSSLKPSAVIFKEEFGCDKEYKKKLHKKTNEPGIVMNNFSASWTENHQTLKNLTVNLKGNKLVIIVGHVGAGKTSFLNAILSELPIKTSDSSISVQGRISYSSQEAWIFPASVRQNILFGLDMNEERYLQVVSVCGLSEDLKQFPDGDMTLVGERGVALSGGQKARVNLARAIYQQADILLLDDPLSAVDTKVSKVLFHDCFQKYLSGKLRILVTHQLQYLPMADHVIVLNRDGTIWGEGSYESLKNSGIDFTSLVGENYFKEELQEESPLGNPSSKSTIKIDKRKSIKKKKTNGLVKPVPKENEEKKCTGSVSFSTYHRYFKAGGSYFVIALLIFTFISTQALNNYVDYWLSIWTNSIKDSESGDDDKNNFTYIYCGLVGGFVVICVFRSCLFFWYCMRISVKVHDAMFNSLSRAPVKFFDDNPSGRIMNRFTKDLNQIDENLPIAFHDFMNILLLLFGMVAVNVAANLFTVVPSIWLLLSLWKMRKFYLATTRDLKRVEALAKSPMFTHITTTVQGLVTIRGLKAEGRMLRQFDKIQDTHTSVHYMLFATSQWFVLYLEMSLAFFLAVVSFGFLFLSSSSVGNVGVAISVILSLSGALQWGVRQSAETENHMTSVERAFEYTNLQPEAPLEKTEDAEISKKWPNAGRITFQDVTLAYDDALQNKILKQVSFSINSLEKVGIVGRTGAGKTSLITALFRLTEPCNGSMTIDGVAIEKIGLHTLRSRFSIIPQDPVLFKGTLRYNLDPFREFNDDQLWSVLEQVDMLHAVRDLDCGVDDGGSNFSVGQKQLVCLARAILRKNKILVLDEATSSCDPATDKLIQNTIRTKFPDCTILTIAHRLQTVLDSDRIMVLDAGKVVEFDTPEVLMQRKGGAFFKMLTADNDSKTNCDNNDVS